MSAYVTVIRQRAGSRRGAAGFTLLELLLVVVILGAMAFVVLNNVTDDVSQVRYEDTRNRLAAIRTAVLGPEEPALWAKGYMSGYVADNGCLPENIDALVQIPTGFLSFRTVEPVFDPDPDSDGFNDGGPEEIQLTNSVYRLMKGHRGAYLASASTNGWYRDGWGTRGTSDFADNHGWDVTGSTNEFVVGSYGMDGAAGTLSSDVNSPTYVYESDMMMSPPISTNDWQSFLFDEVTICKSPDVTVTNTLRAALLICENRAGGLRWRHIVSEPASSWTVGDTNQTSAVFNSTNSMVPVGEHLLVLLSGSTLSDSVLYPGGTNTDYVVKRVKFYPRGGVPHMKLEIR